MEEIKRSNKGFRVWSEKNKAYGAFLTYFIAGNGALYELSFDGELTECTGDEHLEFASNFKDKNGKRIFTNDVIKVEEYEQPFVACEYPDSYGILIRAFNKDKGWFDFDEFNSEKLEIIGNVHTMKNPNNENS